MTSLSPHYSTPKWLYDDLDKEFHFTFDPCPLGGGIDGLSISWGERNYINPPYGRTISLWIKKAFESGSLCVMLLPARTDTKWFHNYCMKADEIRWIKGRLKFGDAKNSAPFPSMICIFKKETLCKNS
jgi:site-specific DNA-methyltransferase (adenine-specific)